jgi:excisionase family DNA binding protein
MLTDGELADRLKVPVGMVRYWAKAGRIPSIRISRKVTRFRLADVLAAVEARQSQAETERAHLPGETLA